jgi:hypothetical protein
VKGYPLHDIRHTVGTALPRSAGVENGAPALGVTPAMMGTYGEHERDARNAVVLASMQETLGTRGATFPNPTAGAERGEVSYLQPCQRRGPLAQLVRASAF